MRGGLAVWRSGGLAGQKNIDSCEIVNQRLERFENVGLQVIEHADFNQWGFKHRGVQPIRFRGSLALSQSDFDNVEIWD